MSIQLANSIDALLDKAKLIHSLPSDYKLALVLGVSFSSIGNYRHGKTLPDARVISLLCDLTGDDPALVLVQVEAERAKTDEARSLWASVFERLSMTARQGVAAGVFSAVALGLMAPAPRAEASPVFHNDVHYV
jgi:transcriptional regulator with XRE-family HTH domain